jgi:hypothetical protein
MQVRLPPVTAVVDQIEPLTGEIETIDEVHGWVNG